MAQGLVRPRRGRILGGVCLAVAERFGISAGLIRLLTVLSLLLPGPQIVIYIICWIVIPSE